MEHKVYIDLDSLLDTRIATVSQIDADAAVKMLGDDYIHRLQDDFRGFSERVTKEAYAEAYAARDVNTLKLSRITHMGQYLFELTADIEAKMVAGLGVEKSKVYLNIFPYMISESDQAEIVEMMQSFVGPLTEVNIIEHDPKQLYPMHLSSQYHVLIMYDFHVWMEHHHKAITQFKNPAVTVVCPALVAVGNEITKSSFTDEQGNQVDPFEATRVLLMEFLGVRMLDSKYFSIAT